MTMMVDESEKWSCWLLVQHADDDDDDAVDDDVKDENVDDYWASCGNRMEESMVTN